MPPTVMSVSAPAATASATTIASFRTLFPPNPNEMASSRFTRMRWPTPSVSRRRLSSSTGDGRSPRDREVMSCARRNAADAAVVLVMVFTRGMMRRSVASARGAPAAAANPVETKRRGCSMLRRAILVASLVAAPTPAAALLEAQPHTRQWRDGLSGVDITASHGPDQTVKAKPGESPAIPPRRWRPGTGIYVIAPLQPSLSALILDIQTRFDPKLARLMPPHITIIGSSGAGPIAPATRVDELRQALAPIAETTPPLTLALGAPV